MYNIKEGKTKLEILPVPNELQQYTMPNHVVIKLNNELEKIRKIYKNKPLDIEFTININKGKTAINILQVRPLVENKIKNKITFVPPSDSKNLTQVPFKLITGGKEACLINPKNIIFANSIAEGLNASYNKQNIDCVVIKTRPSALSHEAIVFNSRGIPVVYLEDSKYSDFQNMVSKANNDNSIILDQQLERFIETNKSKNDALHLIKDGNYSYPTARGFYKKNKINKYAIEDFSKFLQKTKIDVELINRFKQKPTHTLKDIINNLKEASTIKEFERQTESILQILKYSADSMHKIDPRNNLLKEEKMLLISIYKETKELTDLIKNMGISENERLLYIQNLSSLMLNMQTAESANSSSLLNILSKVSLINKQIKGEVKPAKIELNAIGEIAACTDNINTHFQELVKNEPDDQKILKNVIQMQTAGILSEYINIYLSSCDKIDPIVDDETTRIQLDLQTKIKDFENKINGFSSSEYTILQDELVKLTQDFVNSETTEEKSMSQFLFATNASKLLDIWDRSIKKFRENPYFNEENYYQFVNKLSINFTKKFLETVDIINSKKKNNVYQGFYNLIGTEKYQWTAEGIETLTIKDVEDEIKALDKFYTSFDKREGSTILQMLADNTKNCKTDEDKIQGFKKFIIWFIENPLKRTLILPFIQNNQLKLKGKRFFEGTELSPNFNVRQILPSVALNILNVQRLMVRGGAAHPKSVEDLFTFLHQLSEEGIDCIMKKNSSLEKIFPDKLMDLINQQNDNYKKCNNIIIKDNNIEVTFLHTLGTHSASTFISFDKHKKEWKVLFSMTVVGGMTGHDARGVSMALEIFAKEKNIKIKNSNVHSKHYTEFEMVFEDINKFDLILPKLSDICDEYKNIHNSASKYTVKGMFPNYLTHLKNNAESVEIKDLQKLDAEKIISIIENQDVNEELRLKLAVAYIDKFIKSNDIKSDEFQNIEKCIEVIKNNSHKNKSQHLSYIKDLIENKSNEEYKKILQDKFKDIMPAAEDIKHSDLSVNSTSKSKLEFKKLENEEYVITINKKQIARTKEADEKKIIEHIERAIELTANELKIDKKKVEDFLDKLNEVYSSKLNMGNLSAGKREGFQVLDLSNELKTPENAKISALLQKHNKFNTSEGMNYESKGKEVGVRSYRLALLRNAIKESKSNNRDNL